MWPCTQESTQLIAWLDYQDLSKEEVSGKYGFSSATLLEAIELVMFNNRMRFGDIIIKQLSKIAMGMSPALTIANLYVAIYEEMHVLNFVPSTVRYFASSRQKISGEKDGSSWCPFLC